MPIRIQLDRPANDLETVLEAIRLIGLEVQQMRIKSKPDAIHLHIRKPGESGTLEATWRLAENGPEMWFEVRSNRSAPWQKDALDRLLQGIARDVQNSTETD